MDIRPFLTVPPGGPPPGLVDIGLRLVVLAGLVIDAVVHFDLAPTYDGNKKSISQGDLFRIEGVLAIAAAVAILLIRGRLVALIAFAVLAGGVAAVVLYRYVNVGELGPLPNMYEPLWYGKKTQSLWGEVIGAVAALGLVAFGAPVARSVAKADGRSRPGASG